MDKKYLKLKMMGLEPLVYKPRYDSSIYEIFTIVSVENLTLKVFAFKDGKELTVTFLEKIVAPPALKNKINETNEMMYTIKEGLYKKTIEVIFQGNTYSNNYKVMIREQLLNGWGQAIQQVNGGVKI